MWQELMEQVARASPNTTLVAIDLPGLGGSQGLSDYSANSVLDCLCDTICTMRETYFDALLNGKVLVVAHDWGAVLSYKLAIHAPQLANRFVLANGPFVSIHRKAMQLP